MAERVLDMENLHVSFDTYAGEVKAVRGVTLHVDEGEVLAIVGESGCGKSVTAQTIMKLNPMPPARIVEGSINLAGHDIVKARKRNAENSRQGSRYDFPGPDDLHEPDHTGRQADCRVHQAAQASLPAGGEGRGGQVPQAGQHPQPGGARQAVSARVLEPSSSLRTTSAWSRALPTASP